MTDPHLDEALRRAAEMVAVCEPIYIAGFPQGDEAVTQVMPDALEGWAEAIQALRSHGAEVEDRGWHIRECALAFDWSHYEIESPCTCEIERKAIGNFCDTILGEEKRDDTRPTE